jgi:hypothetical protein
MTTATVLASVRTLLDEANASYWENTEVYQSLTDAQNAMCGLALSVYQTKLNATSNGDVDIPLILEPLHTTKSGTLPFGQDTITLPNPVLSVISVQYNPNATTPLYPVRMRERSEASVFQKSNSYLGSIGNDYYVRFKGNIILIFETASAFDYAGYSIEIIAQPIDISASVDPILPDITQLSLVEFAFSKLLAKDQRTQESSDAFNKFMSLSQPLVIL